MLITFWKECGDLINVFLYSYKNANNFFYNCIIDFLKIYRSYKLWFSHYLNMQSFFQYVLINTNVCIIF